MKAELKTDEINKSQHLGQSHQQRHIVIGKPSGQNQIKAELHFQNSGSIPGNELEKNQSLNVSITDLEFKSMSSIRNRPPSPRLIFGEDKFQNYQLLLSELQKKDERILLLKTALNKMRISSNPDEVLKLKNQLEALQADDYKENEEVQQAQQKQYQLEKQTASAEQLFQQRQAEFQSLQKLQRPISELKAELKQLQEETQSLKAKYSSMELKSKMEFEKSYQKEMENKMYHLVLKTAKEHKNPVVQDLGMQLEKKRGMGL